jgi:tRNA A-37 threonylcarbamoyl transferase component Bud32
MEAEPPLPAFICPITQEIMEQPMVTADGHSYSGPSIAAWLEAGSRTSPLTNATLAHTDLLPNISLRHAIEQWRTRQPMAIDPGRVTLSDEVIGAGTNGRVVAGTLSAYGRTQSVAVKQLVATSLAEERRQVEHEIRAHALAAARCDGVCRLFGTCEKPAGRLCIVMKRYCHNLTDVLRAGEGLDEADARRYGHQICRAVSQLHAQRVQHGDLKPSNILMTEFDEPVVADFGLSEALTIESRVMPSGVQGTFNYMAPESFDPEQFGGIGTAADVWALACIILELSSGKPPFQGMNMQQISLAVAEHRQQPEFDFKSAFGERTGQTLRHCFAYEPAERPTAAELAEALLLVEPRGAAGSTAAVEQARAARAGAREKSVHKIECARLRDTQRGLQQRAEMAEAKLRVSERERAALGVLLQRAQGIAEEQRARRRSAEAEASGDRGRWSDPHEIPAGRAVTEADGLLALAVDEPGVVLGELAPDGPGSPTVGDEPGVGIVRG